MAILANGFVAPAPRPPGGIGPDNLGDYLACPFVIAVGGS